MAKQLAQVPMHHILRERETKTNEKLQKRVMRYIVTTWQKNAHSSPKGSLSQLRKQKRKLDHLERVCFVSS